MQNPLFDEFPPVSRAEWLARIEADLKGKPLDRLRWTSEEGLDLFPAFTAEDLPPREWLESNFPGHAPFLRGHHSYGTPNGQWEIRHDFRAESVDDVIRLVNETGSALNGIGLVIGLPFREFLFDWEEKKLPLSKPRDGIYLHQAADMARLLQEINWQSGQQLHLRAGHAVLPVYTYLAQAWTTSTGRPLSELSGTLDADPLNRLGSDPSNSPLYDLLCEDTASVLHHLEAQQVTGLRALRISLEPHHFLGANAVQQIACALGMAAEYVDRFSSDFGFDPATILRHLHFQFPIDTDFFTEIAKVRAFRVLYHHLVAAYGLDTEIPAPYIHGQSAARSLSSLDPHVNMLRTTTQAMSAIMGGCDAVSLAPYNTLSENADAHAIRIARNVQLILKEESFLDRVIDPAGGSYYVEHLSYHFAEAAWKQFQEMEAGGGYLNTWRSGGFIQQMYQQRQQIDREVAKAKRPLLGVNRFPNPKDEPPILMTTGYARDYPLPDRDYFEVPLPERAQAMIDDPDGPGELGSVLEARYHRLNGQLGQSGQLERLAEPFEALRSDAYEYEQDGYDRPRAFLWTFGPLKMRKARANFARNVMGCGGFEVVENETPDDIAATLAHLQAAPPMAIVLCSTDEEYGNESGTDILAQCAAHFPKAQLILAGRPEGWETMQNEGNIHHVIYAGMDLVDFLSQIHLTLGIKEVKHEA